MRSQEELKAEYNDRVKWFTDRVGKTIWRPHDCQCSVCERIYAEGLILADQNHAGYVADVSMEGGIPYFDTEQERNEWEANNPPLRPRK